MEFIKKLSFICQRSRCEFRTIGANDVSDAYVEGLKKQNEYLENNPKDMNKKIQEEYIKRILASDDDTICGLFFDSELIGTAGIQNIMGKREGPTTMGIFLFNDGLRGKGYGKTLVWASAFLTNACHHNTRFGAGMKKQNQPSFRSFISCGFRKVFEDDALIKVELSFESLQAPEFISHVQLLP